MQGSLCVELPISDGNGAQRKKFPKIKIFLQRRHQDVAGYRTLDKDIPAGTLTLSIADTPDHLICHLQAASVGSLTREHNNLLFYTRLDTMQNQQRQQQQAPPPVHPSYSQRVALAQAAQVGNRPVNNSGPVAPARGVTGAMAASPNANGGYNMMPAKSPARQQQQYQQQYQQYPQQQQQAPRRYNGDPVGPQGTAIWMGSESGSTGMCSDFFHFFSSS